MLARITDEIRAPDLAIQRGDTPSDEDGGNSSAYDDASTSNDGNGDNDGDKDDNDDDDDDDDDYDEASDGLLGLLSGSTAGD